MKALLLLLAALLLGCSARRSEPIRGPHYIGDPQVEAGRRVFMASCHKCHPGGEAGLGPALNNKPLPGPLIAMQVRVGLGAMPSFNKSQISDQELKALIRYLKALRHTGVSRPVAHNAAQATAF